MTNGPEGFRPDILPDHFTGSELAKYPKKRLKLMLPPVSLYDQVIPIVHSLKTSNPDESPSIAAFSEAMLVATENRVYLLQKQNGGYQIVQDFAHHISTTAFGVTRDESGIWRFGVYRRQIRQLPGSDIIEIMLGIANLRRVADDVLVRIGRTDEKDVASIYAVVYAAEDGMEEWSIAQAERQHDQLKSVPEVVSFRVDSHAPIKPTTTDDPYDVSKTYSPRRGRGRPRLDYGTGGKSVR